MTNSRRSGCVGARHCDVRGIHAGTWTNSGPLWTQLRSFLPEPGCVRSIALPQKSGTTRIAHVVVTVYNACYRRVRRGLGASLNSGLPLGSWECRREFALLVSLNTRGGDVKRLRLPKYSDHFVQSVESSLGATEKHD